jgi:FG-GAP-like repeat
VDPVNEQRPASRFRILVTVFAVGGVLWFLYSELHRLREQGVNELAKAPDPNLPKYDCLKEDAAQTESTSTEALRDVTDEWKINFQHEVGPLGTWFMPESVGAGAAILDYDRDGRMDLYFVNCGKSPKAPMDFPAGTRSENRLFRQTELGDFMDVTSESGLGDSGYGAGVAIGDVDNDGFPDAFIANYG